MNTPQITIPEIQRWLEAQVPEWAKPQSAHYQLGAMEAIIQSLVNGTTHPHELAARIKLAQTKPQEAA